MYLSTVLIATIAAISPLTSAHGHTHPQTPGYGVANVEKRASPPQCGEGVGSCPAGECCSRAFYCGTTADYCYSPGCNYKYGPGCAENHAPAGTNTSSVPREKVGKVAYGGPGIFRCTQPGVIALTFDDGPQKKFTEHILDLFKSHNAKATFFVTGNNINKGQIDIEYNDVVKRMDAEGHQIASHTWTHLNLSAISPEDRRNQVYMNEMAIRNILGKIPTYLRPPYSACTNTSGCQQDLADLGYHITNFNVDTDDYNQNKPEDIQKSKDWFKGNITKNDASASKGDMWLSIGHDILDQTANNLTEYMLQTISQLGYKAVTIGECLGDDKANWYRTADGAGVSVANNTAAASSKPSGSPAASGSPSPAATGSASISKEGSMSLVAVALFSVAFAYVM